MCAFCLPHVVAVEHAKNVKLQLHDLRKELLPHPRATSNASGADVVAAVVLVSIIVV